MKKFTIIALGFIALLTIGAGCTSKTTNSNAAEANSNAPAVQTIIVTVTIDKGNASPVRTFQQSVPTGTTALAALQLVGSQQTIPVVTKHYDFGDMVTGIDGVVATETKFWIFLVNGKEATVGAGVYQVKVGDTVGFRYGSGS